MRIRSAKDRLTASFTKTECRCRCRRPDCDAKPMDMEFMHKLEALRQEWGRPLLVTSGARCEHWNRKVGGAEHSKHLEGIAADLYFSHPNDATAFAALAEKHGFGGIGLGLTFVHVDNRKERARWTYDDK